MMMTKSDKSMAQYGTEWYSTVHCSTVQYSAVQLLCSVIIHTDTWEGKSESLTLLPKNMRSANHDHCVSL